MPNKHHSLPSYTGLFFTSVLFLILLSYGGLELATVKQYGNTTITVNSIDTYFDSSYEFDLDKGDGLQIAFALTHYDDNFEMLEEPDYGEIKARIRSWSPETPETFFTEVEIRPCTYEELGLSDN